MSIVNPDVNKAMCSIVNTLQHITDKHAPIRKASNAKNFASIPTSVKSYI